MEIRFTNPLYKQEKSYSILMPSFFILRSHAWPIYTSRLWQKKKEIIYNEMQQIKKILQAGSREAH